MRRSTRATLGVILVVGGLVAMVAGAAMGGWNGTEWSGSEGVWGPMMGDGGWMGPGMMGAWGGGTVGQPSAQPSPSGTVIRMNGSAFSPASLTISAGSTVTWLNDDDEPHTVTASDRSWSSGYLAPGATFTRTFASAGSYSYVCLYHPWMQATITVS